MTERGEAFGGPGDVPVTRYPRGQQPQVRLRCDPKSRGVVLRAGPEQSIVRWSNGNEDCVCNEWIKPVDEITTADTEPSKAQGAESDHSQQRAVSGQPQPKSVRSKKEPDALGLRVSEHCGTDAAALKRFALANGCWDDKYDALPNFGLRRMNVVNRLRAKARKGHEVVWK